MKDLSYFDSIDFDDFLDDIDSPDFMSSDDQLLHSSSNDSFTCVAKCAKKKRKVNRNKDNTDTSESFEYVHVPKPRILRADVRRSYGQMMANILNSLDFTLLYGFLDTCCIPNFIQETEKYDHVTGKHELVSLTGKPDVLQYWIYIMQMSPDAVVALKEVNVHLASNTQNMKIVSYFRYNATKTTEKIFCPACPKSTDNIMEQLTDSETSDDSSSQYSDNTGGSFGYQVGQKRKDHDHSPFDHINDHASPSDEEIRKLTEHYENVLHINMLNSPQLAEPVHIQSEGTLTMYTDENKYITRMVMEITGRDEVQMKELLAGNEECPYEQVMWDKQHRNARMLK